MDVLILNDRPFEVIGGGMDLLVLHDRPFDAREKFKARVVEAIHKFIKRAPLQKIQSLRENPNCDLGADANWSLVSVVLATCMEEIGATYKVWDMDNLLLRESNRVAEDLQNNPKIIAVSSSHFTTEAQFADFIHFVRQHNPYAPLVVGGQLLDIYPEIETNVPGVDYYVHGDGEIVFPQLVKAILDHGGSTPVRLPGVRYRDNGTFKGIRDWKLLDINSTSFPRWDLVLKRDFNNFAAKHSPFMPIVFIEEMRGCMHRCAFCAYPRNIPHRLKTVERIINELKQCIQWGFKHFNFYSASFTSPASHCRKILERIIGEGLDITFSCQARVDDLYRNADLIEMMKDAGCIHISLGIESGDSVLLKRMHKPLNVERVPEIASRIHDSNISLAGNFFIGFPGESEATVNTTYSLIKKSNFSTLYLSVFVVERAAEVFLNRKNYGLEVSQDGRKWQHETMNSEQAEELTERFFIKLANDDELRTVLWVVQWRLTRFFPNLLLLARHPEVWKTLRLMQKGVANELESELDQTPEKRHLTRQKRLWERILSCNYLFDESFQNSG